MWLARLRKLAWSKKIRTPIRRKQPRTILKLDYLEERIVPSSLPPVTIFTDSNTPGAGSLRDAILAANADTTNPSGNTITLSSGTYQLTLQNSGSQQDNAQTGDLAITNTNESLTIVGQGTTGANATIINASVIGQLLNDRVFLVNPNVHLTLENLVIEGGKAQDNGSVGAAPGSTASLGGSILNNGGNVTLSNVVVTKNSAAGGAGQNAEGGGIYTNSGSLTLSNTVTIQNNQAVGGVGATGFTGGTGGNAQGGGIYANGISLTLSGAGVTVNNNSINAGPGGNGKAGTSHHATGGQGGAGGLAQGGGVYINGGSLTLSNGATVNFNSVNNGIVQGVHAGSGGLGGAGNHGAGGAGGAGGNAAGGGVYANETTTTSVQVNGSVTINGNSVEGGGGGTGGTAGTGAAGGAGGAGGLAQGGGLFISGGSFSLASAISGDSATGGVGGVGGKGGAGAGAGGVGGNSGNAAGGGVYDTGSNVSLTTGASIDHNTAGGSRAGAGGLGGNGTTKGGAGGAGGTGGTVFGGGLYVTGNNLTVSLSNAILNLNSAAASGAGGNGGFGGNATGSTGQGGSGGRGGDSGAGGGGGAAFFGNNTVTITNSTVNLNALTASQAGNGGDGGSGAVAGTGQNGGNAGLLQGGGLYIRGGSLSVASTSTINTNKVIAAQGGAGGLIGVLGTVPNATPNGAGGNGSEVQGGGLFATGAQVTVNGTISANMAIAGEGGFGGSSVSAPGNGGNGGNGGLGQGGGLFASNGTLTLQNATISANALTSLPGGPGGAAGSGGTAGAAGTSGTAQGAGVALSAMTSPVSVTGTTIDSNVLEFGVGGPGANGSINGANGLTGGLAQGAGLFVQNTTVNAAPVTGVSTTGLTLTNNAVNVDNGGNGFNATKNAFLHTGGNGGSGGSGGMAQGGGLYATGSTVTLKSSTVSGNALNVDNGGSAGLGVSGAANGVAGNGGSGGSGQGAGAYATGGTLTLFNTSVASNTLNVGVGANGLSGSSGQAGGAGGAAGTNGTGQGGGLFTAMGTTLNVTNSTLANNTLNIDNGGAGGNGKGGTSNHQAGGQGGAGGLAQGGGLYAGGSTLTLINATIAANALRADIGGAGGHGTNGVGGNGGAGGANATGQGGGLFASGGSLSMTNDTVATNAVTVAQGGAFGTGTTGNGSSGSNGANGTAQAGGLYKDSSNTATLENTIIALDTIFSGSSSPNDVFGSISSSGNNFIGDADGSSGFSTANHDQFGTTASPLNPNLAPLANYGGPTLTMVPMTGSPVIGQGNLNALSAIAAAEGVSTANATDQRGFARTVNNTIDIGADQYQAGLTIGGTATPASVQAGQNITYSFTITNNGPDTVTNVTLTDVLPANTTFVSLTTPTGWTPSTPAVGQNGTVTATMAANTSLTTGQSATFTLVVKVNSNVSGGTTISNTASVTPTQGNTQQGNASVTLNTTVSSSIRNITNEIGILQSTVFNNPLGGRNSFVQAVALINNSGAAIQGPVALVLTGLPAGVTLTNATGTFNGSPYINIVPPNGTWQPGLLNAIIVILEFHAPNRSSVHYTPEVLQGI